MDANKILYLKELLYDSGKQDVKISISQMKDQEMLYAFAYNYNWDNGFDIPQEILDNEKCDLSIALLIFYRADGLSYLEEKSEDAQLPQWSTFIKNLYHSIMSGKYSRGEIEFRVPLTKVQIYKLKKIITEAEKIFVEDIDGKCLDIDV